MQINALKALKRMAESYGYDISKPYNAKNHPMVLFSFILAATKDQNGAAMSIGEFLLLDIYRDIKEAFLQNKKSGN